MHIITMLVLLSILILIHEMGHFMVARMLGIKAEKFGFGLPFGPTLYKTKWGDTEVCIHAFLLGGYVSFPDDNPDSNIPENDPRRISNRKVWERAAVVSAGVTANALIAYFLVLFVAGFSGELPSGKYNVFVKDVLSEKNLSAKDIGIKPGDKILYANGVLIDSPVKFISISQKSKKFDGYVSPDIINKKMDNLKKINPSINTNIREPLAKGIKVYLPSISYENPLTISDDLIAESSKYIPEGIKLSDKEEKLRNFLDGKKVYIADGNTSLINIANAISDSSHSINIVVDRKGKELSLDSVYPNEKGIIGIKLQTEEINFKINGPVVAIKKSWDYLYQNTYYMIYGLWKIITGQIPLENVHGIVAITKVGSDIIEKKGLFDGLLLTALISMDLAIVNLLPIPALDGGHLMFLIIEKLIGRPVSEKTQESFAKFGFIFLISLMILIIFNDIFALVTDKF